jgi:hypothetical protein
MRTTLDSSSWPGRWCQASMMNVSADADRSQQAERLEHMKSEFLVAQQRRRDKSARAADRPVDPDHESPITDQRADTPSPPAAVGTLEPRN